MKKKTIACIGIAAVLTFGTVISASAIVGERGLGHGRGRGGNCSRSDVQRNEDCVGYDSVDRVKGRDLIENILAEKFDITSEELTKLYDEGKSLSEIIKDKDIDTAKLAEEFKSARLLEIDKALESGDITADEAETIKENFTSHMEDMDFENHFGQGHRKGNGNGRGHGRGMGRGRHGN